MSDISISNPYPGELTITGPQTAIDELVTNCRCNGIPVSSYEGAGAGQFDAISNADQPEPLGQYEWNFSPPQKAAPKVDIGHTPVMVVNTATDSQLGHPEWLWGDDAAQFEELTLNREDAGDGPAGGCLGHPRWDW